MSREGTLRRTRGEKVRSASAELLRGATISGGLYPVFRFRVQASYIVFPSKLENTKNINIQHEFNGPQKTFQNPSLATKKFGVGIETSGIAQNTDTAKSK